MISFVHFFFVVVGFIWLRLIILINVSAKAQIFNQTSAKISIKIDKVSKINMRNSKKKPSYFFSNIKLSSLFICIDHSVSVYCDSLCVSSCYFQDGNVSRSDIAGTQLERVRQVQLHPSILDYGGMKSSNLKSHFCPIF